MKHFPSLKKNKVLARTVVLVLCLGFFSHARAADPSDFETEEYFKSTGLGVINASTAYSKGYTGKGITVGISDIPVNFTSPEFNTKQSSYVADDFSPPYIDENETEHNVTDSDYWQFADHGTHVAGIAAASRNRQGMHGVAFDGELVSSSWFDSYSSWNGAYVRPGWADAFFDAPTIKIVNCSWGDHIYPLELVEENERIRDFMDRYCKGTIEGKVFTDTNSPLGKEKLFVWSAGNDGYPMPALYNGLAHWYEGRAVATNGISVTALEDTKYLKKEEDRIHGFNILNEFSTGASFNEDGTLAAPGSNIVSANANYVRDNETDITDSGTSMAAPYAAGTAALVQQAFPYMTGKQLGDVLLSTANPNVVSINGCTVTIQIDSEGLFINVYYGNGTPRTLAQQKQDCYNGLLNPLAAYGFTPERLQQFVDRYPIHDYYNVPMEALIGQGILDAGKAVDGPGALNARRLEKSDISNAYTVGGVTMPQALYAVDTAGYDSTWANDIKEVRVSLLAADSTEEDLKTRYNYYKTNWLDRTRHGSGNEVVGKEFVKAYIDFFNEDATNSGLVDLPVGLLKSGEGRLSLTGNNTYKGASIAKQGTLSIDGSVAGDAYSIEKGTIAGRGTINGTLYNQNIAVAGDATGSGNLTMDKLISCGVLLSQYQNGTNTQFIVKGKADINGSTVPVPLGATPMPDDKYTVVKAATIEGTTNDLAGTEYELTGMLSAKNEIEGGNLSVVVEAANNLNGADAVQKETFDAMTAMYRNLKRNNDPRMNDMQPLFYMDAATAKDTLSAIGSTVALKSMAVAQRGDAAGRVLSSRLSENGTNDFWVKFGKSWGHLRDKTDAHSSTALLGWDRKISPRWRFGVFAGYGRTSLSDKTAGSEMREQRFGLYADHVKGRNETMLFLDYGWMRTKLHRTIAPLGLMADATYHSQILELGGEYRYDLHADTNAPWHVRPFVNAQLSRLWQNGYNESGAGVFGHEAQDAHNDYFAAGAGIEFKRSTKSGDLAIRLGLRHAFAGAEPKLRFRYSGDKANSYDMRTAQDTTHFVCSLGGEAKFAHGWTIAGEAGLTRGAHDKEWSCSVTVKRMW